MKLTHLLSASLLLLLACNSTEKKASVSEITSSEEKPKQQNSELAESMKRGQDIYTDFCVTCHLPNGKGVPNAFPPLAQSDYLMNKRKESIHAIKFGQSGEITVNGKIYNNVMAPLGLENREIADVMNYITNSWGNTNNTLITEQEVSKIDE